MFKMKKTLIIVIILSLLAISGCELEKEIESEKILNQAQVNRVIDGDTLELVNGEKVRLLHINTPEKGEFCYEEAKNKLEELILNKSIFLERDMQANDKYNRSLSYIYLDKEDKSVNQILVEEGYAVAYILLPNTKYHQQFVDSERQAIENKKGCLWQNVSEYYGCFEVQELMKCEEGDYVILENECDDIDIDGWLLRNQGRSKYSLNGIIEANSTIKIEREGWQTTHDCIWNDFSDTLFLFDNENKLVLRYHF